MAITTLDEYLKTIPNDDNRSRMVAVLNWVAEHYPELELRIAWNQPTFTHHGTYIIAFSAASKHMVMAPEFATMIRFEPVMRERGTPVSPGTSPSTTNSLTRSSRISSQTNATSRRSGAPRNMSSKPPRPSHPTSIRPPSASARQTTVS